MSHEEKRGRSRRGRGNHRGEPKSRQTEPSAPVDESSVVVQQFLGYQKCLDTRHDKHERLVKLSRDVTIDSKRTIFMLQRISSDEDKLKILPEAASKLKEIQTTRWRPIADELEGEDPYQFLRAYSPGLQEYIEAISFHRFLDCGEMISPEEVAETLVFQREVIDEGTEQEESKAECEISNDPSPQAVSEPIPTSTSVISVHIPPMEYMLGIADLTGEVMRMAIHSVGSGNVSLPAQYCRFLRAIHEHFLLFGNTNRELSRKMFTLKQSLQKVEAACYTLQVRGSEIPKHMLVDVLQTMDSYGEENTL